jgi:hypothetical protein
MELSIPKFDKLSFLYLILLRKMKIYLMNILVFVKVQIVKYH